MGWKDKERRRKKKDKIAMVQQTRVTRKAPEKVEQRRVKVRELSSIMKTILNRARSNALIVNENTPNDLKKAINQLLKWGYLKSVKRAGIERAYLATTDGLEAVVQVKE